ncbi:hypothetical protein BKA60DRAFT_602330 [Fusarium oxysporum]|nr:hypothetical protein BKA60DRAFT_602330 [Fusarium oxysporum]
MARLIPEIEGVTYQRFFPSREGSKWFQVNIQTKGRADRSKAKSSTKKPQETPRVLTSEASTHLQQVIDREARYREALGQPRTTIYNTGTDTFAATSLLPDRHSLNTNYTLGQGNLEGTPNLVSPREDEQKISCIMRALGLVIDRCEETVCCTSHNILCWLLSSRLQSQRSSEIRYRRTQKQFLAFILRIYRMPSDSRREIMNPVMERQGSPPVGTHSGPIGGQSTDVPLNIRACQGLDRKEGAEDVEIDDENVEAWELEDEDDNEDDYDDSGYYDNDANSTESFLNGQPSSTLLIYFSGILRFSYYLKLSAMIYIQRILFLEQVLPLQARYFKCFDEVRAKYMVLGSQYPLAELISLRDFGRNVARTKPPSILFH